MGACAGLLAWKTKKCFLFYRKSKADWSFAGGVVAVPAVCNETVFTVWNDMNSTSIVSNTWCQAWFVNPTSFAAKIWHIALYGAWLSCCSRYGTPCYYARLAQSRWWLNSGLNGPWNGVKIPQLLVPVPTVCPTMLAILRAPLSLASNFLCMSPLQGLNADVPLNLELPDYLPAACAAVKRCSAAPGHFPLFIT